MSDWEASKQKFIDRLSNAAGIFDEIFRVDEDGLVIQGDERDDLKNLQAANKKILDKLKSREFTVAIVGLEKAGKSTLGNALIKSMVLPEYEASRCTYTTTEIRAGSTDIAEVYFYSREEFNENFKRMLNDVKYPDAVNFDTMTLETFVRYWKAVMTDPAQRGTFLLFDATVAKDLKTILAGKQKISSLLGHGMKEFGAEFWNGDDKFNEFKVYITGMAGKKSDGTIRTEPYPYAVKNVIIRSTQLADMSHIVLYDVPGFDSPTELHKRQTEEMLKEADAIILVTNAGDRANLSSTQLDMLRKVQDDDGVKLSEKSFVFGNKIDRASTAAAAQEIFRELRNDVVNTHQIALDNHIVIGSARAYLEKLGLITEKVASEVLGKWQMADGMTVLLDKMQTYYDNDRFAVLKRRAESTLAKTRTVLQNLVERYSTGELNHNDASVKIFMDIQSRLETFTDEAYQITQLFTSKIFNERPFTNALKDDVEKIYPFVEEAHTELIQRAELNGSIDSDGVYPTSKVDVKVRDDLNVQFQKNIVISASKFTDERQRELQQALIDSFLKIMGVEQATNYRAELDESVKKLFGEMLVDGGAECNFNSLVERFVMPLIQTLIMQPFASEERCRKVKETLDELVSLSVYYNMPTDRDEKNSLRLENLVSGGNQFFARILAHEDFSASTSVKIETAVDAADNEIFLRELFNERRRMLRVNRGASVAIDSLQFERWAGLLTKVESSRHEELVDALETLFDDEKIWRKRKPDEKVQDIENVITNYANQFGGQRGGDAGSLIAQIDSIHARAKKFKRMNGKEDMITTLDADIKILRDITARAVINAIGLERAFNSVITKNVELIRTNLKDTKEGNAAYRAWIRDNAEKLMPSQFEQINEQGAVRENKKAIVNAVKNLLRKWE